MADISQVTSQVAQARQQIQTEQQRQDIARQQVLKQQQRMESQQAKRNVVDLNTLRQRQQIVGQLSKSEQQLGERQKQIDVYKGQVEEVGSQVDAYKQAQQALDKAKAVAESNDPRAIMSLNTPQERKFYQQIVQNKESAINQTLGDLEAQGVDTATLNKVQSELQTNLGKISNVQLKQKIGGILQTSPLNDMKVNISTVDSSTIEPVTSQSKVAKDNYGTGKDFLSYAESPEVKQFNTDISRYKEAGYTPQEARALAGNFKGVTPNASVANMYLRTEAPSGRTGVSAALLGKEGIAPVNTVQGIEFYGSKFLGQASALPVKAFDTTMETLRVPENYRRFQVSFSSNPLLGFVRVEPVGIAQNREKVARSLLYTQNPANPPIAKIATPNNIPSTIGTNSFIPRFSNSDFLYSSVAGYNSGIKLSAGEVALGLSSLTGVGAFVVGASYAGSIGSKSLSGIQQAQATSTPLPQAFGSYVKEHPIEASGAALFTILGASSMLRTVEPTITGLASKLSISEKTKSFIRDTNRIASGPIASEYGYLGKGELSQAQELRAMKSTDYGLLGKPQLTRTQQFMAETRLTKYGILGNIEKPLTNTQKLLNQESTTYGLIGRSPEALRIQNMKNAVKNANYELTGLEGTYINPVRGYNYAKNQIKQSAIGFINRNIKTSSSEYGLLGKSSESLRVANMQSAVKNANYELTGLEGTYINPVRGYNYAKNQIFQKIKGAVSNKATQYGLIGRSPEALRIQNMKEAIRNSDNLINYPDPVTGYNSLRGTAREAISLAKYNLGNKIRPIKESIFTTSKELVKPVSETYAGMKKVAQNKDLEFQVSIMNARMKYGPQIGEETLFSKYVNAIKAKSEREFAFDRSVKQGLLETKSPIVIYTEPEKVIQTVEKISPTTTKTITTAGETSIKDIPTIVGGEGGKSQFAAQGTYEQTVLVKPSVGQLSKEESIVQIKSGESTVTQITKPAQILSTKNMRLQSTEPIVSVSNPTAYGFKTNQSQNQNQQIDLKLGQENRLSQESKVNQLPAFMESQAFVQKEVQQTKQKQEQRQNQDSIRIIGDAVIRSSSSKKAALKSGLDKLSSSFDIFIRRKKKDFKIGTTESKGLAAKSLMSRLKSDLSASGYVIEKSTGRKLSFQEIGLDMTEFRPAKKDMFRVVQREGKRLGSFGERKEIQMFKKQKSRRINFGF